MESKGTKIKFLMLGLVGLGLAGNTDNIFGVPRNYHQETGLSYGANNHPQEYSRPEPRDDRNNVDRDDSIKKVVQQFNQAPYLDSNRNDRAYQAQAQNV